MGGPPEPSTDRGLPIQWWHVVAVGTAVWVLLMATTDLEWLLEAQLYDAITTSALLAWPLIPLAMYLDLRAIRDDVAWNPATKSWLLVSLVPIVNVPAGLAYCLRRRNALSGELPSPHWRYGVYAGLLVWIGVLAVDGVAGHVGADLGALDLILTNLLIVAWLGLPVAVYFDAIRFSGYPDREPRFRGLVVLSAVPLLNVFLIGVYAGVRWWELRKLGPDTELARPGNEDAGSTRPEPISPWYRRAVGVFVGYVLLVVVVGWGLSLESDGAWLGLELAGWLPFGIFFTTCLHFDVRDVRNAGVSWGGTRYLYYSSVIFPGPAFYYLLRRLTKVHGARSKGLLDGSENEDGDGGDFPPDDEQETSPDPGMTDASSGSGASDAQTGSADPGFQWAGDPDR